MACLRFTTAVLGPLLFAPLRVSAHCNAVDGPAMKALDTQNVRGILPYAPAQAEPEIVSALEEAVAVRTLSPRAKALVERYSIETAVRLHRVGEGAAYTGL
jgi:hypothetical protein